MPPPFSKLKPSKMGFVERTPSGRSQVQIPVDYLARRFVFGIRPTTANRFHAGWMCVDLL